LLASVQALDLVSQIIETGDFMDFTWKSRGGTRVEAGTLPC